MTFFLSLVILCLKQISAISCVYWKPNAALGMVMKVCGEVESESAQRPVIRHVFLNLYLMLERFIIFTVKLGCFLWLYNSGRLSLTSTAWGFGAEDSRKDGHSEGKFPLNWLFSICFQHDYVHACLCVMICNWAGKKQSEKGGEVAGLVQWFYIISALQSWWAEDGCWVLSVNAVGTCMFHSCPLSTLIASSCPLSTLIGKMGDAEGRPRPEWSCHKVGLLEGGAGSPPFHGELKKWAISKLILEMGRCNWGWGGQVAGMGWGVGSEVKVMGVEWILLLSLRPTQTSNHWCLANCHPYSGAMLIFLLLF